MAEQKYYVRKASGLVRNVTGIDVLLYNIFMIGVMYISFFVFIWVAYPGSSLFWAIIVCTIGGIAQSIVYALFSSVYPRSGGEYVYLTRTIPPWLGFMFSWNLVAINVFWVGSTAANVSFYSLAPMFSYLGLLTGSPSYMSLAQWMDSSVGIFVVGSVIILLFAALMIRGMKVYFMFQRLAFVAAIAAVIIGAVVMAVTPLGAFILTFNHFMEPLSHSLDTYHLVLDTAKQNGYSWPAFSSLQTLKITVWIFANMGYCALSSSFAGEIKDVRKSQLFGTTFAVIIVGISYVVWSELAMSDFGADFLRAISYLSLFVPQAGAQAGQFPTLPYMNLFLIMMAATYHPVLAAIIVMGYTAVTVMIPATCLIYASRGILAWSIDRLTPDILGRVNDRWHTPTAAISLVAAIGIVLCAAYAFTGAVPVLMLVFLWSIFGSVITFFGTVVVGMLFPYLKKEVYKGSSADIEIAGVPLMTIAGVIATVYIGSMIYWFLTDSFVGTNSPTALATILVTALVGVPLYFCLRWWRKRDGIDVEHAFREIPID